MAFAYANPTSGPSAGGIGWIDFENLTMNPGDSVTLSGTLNNGDSVSFDLTMSLVSGTPRAFIATSLPTYPLAQFGVAGYTGMSQNVALYSPQSFGITTISSFVMSNIMVKDPQQNPISNYTVLIADAESTNLLESIQGQTNGNPWNLFTVVGNGSVPTLTGVGTQNFSIVGTQQFGVVQANIMSTQGPTQISLTISNEDPYVTRQAFSIGFAITKLTLQKNIGQRIDSSDQFVLDITGALQSQATTSGNSNGIQTQQATIYADPNVSYSLNESMADGSTSLLQDYIRIVSASNATPAGSIPPTKDLPISFTPALGDNVTYTILNAAPEVFQKKVDKAYADVGEILTYTVTIENPNNFTIYNVAFNDATPDGTSYIGNLVVSGPFTGNDPASGLIITSIAPASSVSISWQVLVNSFPPIPNPVPNYANIVVPQGTSGMSNVVTTQVNTAYVTIMKMVDKMYANKGDVLTYTLLLHNAGNVAASNVMIRDILPSGVTFLQGTLIGATGIPPTFNVIGDIPSMSDVMVSFQVKLDNTLPSPNPVVNSARVTYSYTVDPQLPNNVTKFNQSNLVSTYVNEANVTIIKAVDKKISYVNDTITYQLALTNIGNTPANNIVIKDILANGLQYVNNSFQATVPASISGSLITILQPLNPGQSISITFEAKVITMPIPNPILNTAIVNYIYQNDPNGPIILMETISNTVCTKVFRNAYPQQITDIITSVALEEAALAAIINAEGAKIQNIVSSTTASTQELLCINKSVEEMMASIALLEMILKQKIRILDCQIKSTCE